MTGTRSKKKEPKSGKNAPKRKPKKAPKLTKRATDDKRNERKVRKKPTKKKIIVAKGRLAKRMVATGQAERTSGFMTKDDIILNSRGKYVSRKKSEQAKTSYVKNGLHKYNRAVGHARKLLDTKGFVPIGGKTAEGQELLEKAKMVYKMQTGHEWGHKRQSKSREMTSRPKNLMVNKPLPRLGDNYMPISPPRVPSMESNAAQANSPIPLTVTTNLAQDLSRLENIASKPGTPPTTPIHLKMEDEDDESDDVEDTPRHELQYGGGGKEGGGMFPGSTQEAFGHMLGFPPMVGYDRA